MAILIMPDGTTFAVNTLDALAEQWAAWVHGVRPAWMPVGDPLRSPAIR